MGSTGGEADAGRKAVRVSLTFEDFRSFITQYDSHISMGGIFIGTRSPLPPGTPCKLDVKLKDGYQLIEGLGEVAWTRDRAQGPDRPPGMGVRFRELAAASRDLIFEIVDRRLVEGSGVFQLDKAGDPQPQDIPDLEEILRRAERRREEAEARQTEAVGSESQEPLEAEDASKLPFETETPAEEPAASPSTAPPEDGGWQLSLGDLDEPSASSGISESADLSAAATGAAVAAAGGAFSAASGAFGDEFAAMEAQTDDTDESSREVSPPASLPFESSLVGEESPPEAGTDALSGSIAEEVAFEESTELPEGLLFADEAGGAEAPSATGEHASGDALQSLDDLLRETAPPEAPSTGEVEAFTSGGDLLSDELSSPDLSKVLGGEVLGGEVLGGEALGGMTAQPLAFETADRSQHESEDPQIALQSPLESELSSPDLSEILGGGESRPPLPSELLAGGAAAPMSEKTEVPEDTGGVSISWRKPVPESAPEEPALGEVAPVPPASSPSTASPWDIPATPEPVLDADETLLSTPPPLGAAASAGAPAAASPSASTAASSWPAESEGDASGGTTVAWGAGDSLREEIGQPGAAPLAIEKAFPDAGDGPLAPEPWEPVAAESPAAVEEPSAAPTVSPPEGSAYYYGPSSKSRKPLLFGLLGLLAVAAVAAFLLGPRFGLFGGGEDVPAPRPEDGQTAAVDPSGTPAPEVVRVSPDGESSEGSPEGSRSSDDASPDGSSTADESSGATPSPAAGGPTPSEPASGAVAPTVAVSEPVGATSPATGPMTMIRSITSKTVPEGTLVTLTADGAIRTGQYRYVRISAGQPRLLVRLLGVDKGDHASQVTAGTSEVRGIRTGYHAGNTKQDLHVVLDLASPSIDTERIEARGNQLLIWARRPGG